MAILVPSFLDGSSSIFNVTRVTIKAWMSLNFGQTLSSTTGFGIPQDGPGTAELASLERLEKIL